MIVLNNETIKQEAAYYRDGRRDLQTPLKYWDVSAVTDFSSLFYGVLGIWEHPENSIVNWQIGTNIADGASIAMQCMFMSTDFNQDISGWDTSKVNNMLGMFSGNKVFNQPLNTWVVSNVTMMGSMFEHSVSFNQDLSKWDVSKVRDMSNMFHTARSFDQYISEWNVSNVTSMISMFYGAVSFNQPLHKWKLHPNCSTRFMFGNTPAFQSMLPTLLGGGSEKAYFTVGPFLTSYSNPRGKGTFFKPHGNPSGIWTLYETISKSKHDFDPDISLKDFIYRMNHHLRAWADELGWLGAVNAHSKDPLYNLIWHPTLENNGVHRELMEWSFPKGYQGKIGNPTEASRHRIQDTLERFKSKKRRREDSPGGRGAGATRLRQGGALKPPRSLRSQVTSRVQRI